ncbi:transmembrane protein 138 [Discoglossus pictus]
MLQPDNYSLVLSLQFLLLLFDLFVNSFSELLRSAPVIQLVLFILQDVGTLFAAIILFLMLFNTFVFQAGLLGLLCQRFQVTVMICALHLGLSVALHVWIMNLRWKTQNVFIWSDGLLALYVLQRFVAVLYFYFYKRTILNLGDSRFYHDSLWLRKEFARIRGWRRRTVLSSTPLEVLFFLNGWYCASYFLIETLVFIYKGLILPYPTSNLVLEAVILFLYLGIEVSRLILGCRGNLCERKLPLVVSVGLTIPAALLALYFLFLQTYALRLETVLSCILLLFYALEAVLSCAALVTFCREPTY